MGRRSSRQLHLLATESGVTRAEPTSLITPEPERPPKPVHPFPARMASEIASEAMSELKPNSTVVDPMCGSGMVLRQAVQQDHKAIGVDVDPLAILMSRVWTRSLDTSLFLRKSQATLEAAARLRQSDIHLPWIDDDDETARFIDFWFGSQQKKDLRALAYLVSRRRGPINQALQLAISRIIVTKKVGASLAWDVSHSRPHRVKVNNNYDVLNGFENAVFLIAEEISKLPSYSRAWVKEGNARRLSHIPSEYADIVITSPPYFNAIDYIRGHRLALVWLGYRVSRLRQIRSSGVGSEQGLSFRRLNNVGLNGAVIPDGVDSATQSRLRRYAFDMTRVMSEIHRILRPGGRAVLVVASSNIHGHKIDNPALIESIGEFLGLRSINYVEREIPNSRRYLPPPSATTQESLIKRMRTESVLTFEKGHSP